MIVLFINIQYIKKLFTTKKQVKIKNLMILY